MTTRDLLHETFSALTTNKVRTALTMLGIIIGISSVITMVSIGQGAQGSIQASIESIGSNLLIVFPGAERGPGYQVSTGRGSSHTLTPADATAIGNEIANVAAVSPEISGRYQVTAKGTNTNTSVTGVTPAYATVHNFQVNDGRFIINSDITNLSKVAVIGPTTASDLFGAGNEAVGQVIRIKGIQFTVVGVTVSKGASGGFNNQDDVVFVPLPDAQLFLLGDTTYLTNIGISANSSQVMTQVQNDITTLLLNRHHISDPTQADFNVLNQASIVSAASSVTGTFTILLAAVAGISLLVGGIGIMNMMLTTVTERTKEIGLRKAIGATRHDISIQFLAEAVALTVLGGAIGVALGWLAAYVVTKLGVLQTSISISSVILAFGVSAAIGIIFGYYPARRASRLNPIEALRYE
ncbi:ABC transporter permease [Patescibacteria group bacterium]|nr:ABC transporter permease [Patescibacteria group bacterium]MDE1946280.1 ABC transporter permease [Patescibacteria group bacterium]MDE2010732.1 ABC transporter permease [Patescibacteria group bacterium]MDE2232616.1 ABC transporter permease [Patescibacteria group bacterium]